MFAQKLAHSRHPNRMGAAHDERGASVSVLIAAAIPAFILVCGLAVDGAHQVSAQRKAALVAAQAARVGVDSSAGERLNGDQAVELARSAAMDEVAETPGMAATTHVDADGQLHVDVTTSIDTAFLPIIGINSLPAQAGATAQLRRN